MAEIDPITREALRRASQMRNRTHKAPVSESRDKKAEHIKTPESEQKAVKPPVSDPIKAFFKDKEESIILLLVLLLMEEKADPALLLALMYLLI